MGYPCVILHLISFATSLLYSLFTSAQSLCNYVTDHSSPQHNSSFLVSKPSLLKPAQTKSDFLPASLQIHVVYPICSHYLLAHAAWPHSVRHHDMYQVCKCSGYATHNRYTWSHESYFWTRLMLKRKRQIQIYFLSVINTSRKIGCCDRIYKMVGQATLDCLENPS